MSADDLLNVCVVVLLGVVILLLWLSTLGPNRGRQQAVRMQTEVIALRAGETFVGVIDRSRGPAIFLVHDATDGRNNA
jgi:hypothetical protein